ARMAQEQGAFNFGDVVYAINEKLIRRHPHVFGDTKGMTSEAVKGLWDKIKAEEKAERDARRGGAELEGALSGIPVTLPALPRAQKLQSKAGKVGFDWNDPLAVLAKIREEIDEVSDEIAAGNKAAAAEEVGDLMFAVVNLARHLDADAEGALRGANDKFERRFGAVEA